MRIISMVLLAMLTITATATQYTTPDCPFTVPDGERVDCYIFNVPQDYDTPDGAQISLPVAIIPGMDADAPPLVMVNGGPGLPIARFASSIFSDSAFNAIREGYTLVWVEQRGIGNSEPLLNCPAL